MTAPLGVSWLAARGLAGGLLILGSVLFLPAGLLYAGRAIWQWPSGETALHLYWERGLVMAAFLASLLGFALLEGLLQEAGETLWARPALALYLISAAALVVIETANMAKQAAPYPRVVAYVVLVFLAQAAFGAALARARLVAGWIGWLTIAWSLAWLVILPIARPREMYYPWLFYVAPLIIGIALQTK